MRIFSSIFLLLCAPLASAQDVEYKLTQLEKLAKVSPIAIHAEAMGRLFVGGSNGGLFVYEPNNHNSYEQPKVLYSFPKSSAVRAINHRNLYDRNPLS